MFDITHPATTTYIVSIYVCILSVHTSVYIHTFYVQGVGCHFCGGCCVCTMPEGPFGHPRVYLCGHGHSMQPYLPLCENFAPLRLMLEELGHFLGFMNVHIAFEGAYTEG